MRIAALTLVSVLSLALPTLAAQPQPAAPAPAAAPPAAPAPAEPVFPLPPGVGKLVPPSEIPALQNVVQPGTEIRFMGEEYGLKSYFLSNQGQGRVVYVTPDGQGFLNGMLLGGDGTAITVMQIKRLGQTGFDPTPFLSAATIGSVAQPVPPAPPEPAAAQPPAAAAAQTTPPPTPSLPQAEAQAPAAETAPRQSPGEQLITEAKTASWIGFGSPSAPVLYVFMDPNCDHCHNFFKMILPYTLQNKIYLRVIPVSAVDIVKSPAEIVNTFSSRNPAATWTARMNGQAVPLPGGINPRAELALAANNDMFKRWRLPGTPYAVYRARSDSKVHILYGPPESLPAFIAELGAQP